MIKQCTAFVGCSAVPQKWQGWITARQKQPWSLPQRHLPLLLHLALRKKYRPVLLWHRVHTQSPRQPGWISGVTLQHTLAHSKLCPWANTLLYELGAIPGCRLTKKSLQGSHEKILASTKMTSHFLLMLFSRDYQLLQQIFDLIYTIAKYIGDTCMSPLRSPQEQFYVASSFSKKPFLGILTIQWDATQHLFAWQTPGSHLFGDISSFIHY